jgi:hypothetical protein
LYVAFKPRREDWIEGQTNGAIPNGLDVFCIAPLVWLVLAGWLLIRALLRFGEGAVMQRIRWPLLLVLAAWPCGTVFLGPAVLPSSRDLFGGFAKGFASWTRRNVDASAIRQRSQAAPESVN